MDRLLARISLIIVLVLSLSTVGLCATNPLEVKGYGETKDMALKDALRTAIEIKVGTLIDSKTIVEKNQIIKDTIYAKSDGYVKSYNITNEYKSNSSYCLTVQVIVDDSPNSELVSRLQSMKNIETNLNNPRIGVVFIRKDHYYNRYIPVETANSSVVTSLSTKGFTRVLDIGMANQNRDASALYSVFVGNPIEAVTIAKQHSVDYIIVGELKPHSVGNVMGSGVYSYRTAATWKIISTGTAQIIGAGSAITSGVDITPDIAMEKSMSNIGDAISSKIVDSLSTLSMQISQSVLIKARSMDSVSFQQLVSTLGNIQGVERCFVRFFQNGTGEIDVSTSNSPYDMSLLLRNLGYNIIEINTNIVTIGRS